MKNKKLIKVLAWSGSVLAISFVVLVVHIYLVTLHPKPTNQIQLSRIDFKEEINEKEAQKIKGFVTSLPDVNAAYFNLKDHILVYTYKIGNQNSLNVFNQIKSFGNYKAERYLVSEAAAKNGCPVGKVKKSFWGTLISYISKNPNHN